jgi:KipI family sensor histidine kinase inhibitor
VAATIERLTEIEFTVAFCGFAPGFAYMSGLADEWSVPRLDAPRPRVPAGAVALAGAYAGIYPTASPGGWRLVGRTDQNLFDVRREPPALLTPGTRVRLTEAR